ncbi:MAG: hypothetical protein JEY99_14740 [Spirochaetales bacterium]|nr:hypothetical protein [Spirochaetales bacterium]
MEKEVFWTVVPGEMILPRHFFYQHGFRTAGIEFDSSRVERAVTAAEYRPDI